MAEALRALVSSWPFSVLELYLALYPLAFSFLVVISSRQFLLDRMGIVTHRTEPTTADVDDALTRWPTLSVLISARDEVDKLGDALDSVLGLAWPNIELVVVDDGSTDGTSELLERYQIEKGIGVLHHRTPRGKASSLNEALASTHGEIILVMDADATLVPETAVLLAAQLAHHPDLGAVTANPRMLRTERLLEKLQAIEFSATVAVQRRGHAAWGRISTMSGICTLLRRSALDAVGGFDPLQPAEDIELTWRLQVNGWRVGFEPEALVGMHAPRSLATWWRQRRRWTKGLVRSLTKQSRDLVRPRNYAVWPLALEGVGSLLWAHLLVLLSLVWLLCLSVGIPLHGNSLVVGAWGALVMVASTAQILWGIHLDQRYDPGMSAMRTYTPLFPLFYWILLAVAATSAAIPGLLRAPRSAVTWRTDR